MNTNTQTVDSATTTATHTPGPWKVYHPISTAESLGIDAASGESVVVWGERHEGIIGERREANARLIAAAPDMLEALKITRGNVSSLYASHPKIWDKWLEVIDDAIAKATGGAS